MIISFPYVYESKRSVVRGVITQFQAGEDSRSAEEGVDQESGPRVRTVIRLKPSGYGLITTDVRHREGIWRGRGTLRNISASTVASTGNKPIEEVLPHGITLKIDDAVYPLSVGSALTLQ